MWKSPSPLSLLTVVVLAASMTGGRHLAVAVGDDDVDADYTTDQGDAVLVEVMKRLQSDVLNYRNEVESAYQKRCTSASMNTCQENNYNECSSQYPNQTCPSSDHAVISACGKGERCNGLFDWSVSTVRLPGSLTFGPERNPTDPAVIETVCYSRQTDEFLKSLFETSDSFWEEHGMPYHPMMYFGANNGAFRIFPARQSDQCGAYDPRNRPWYEASVPWLISEASNGRDVVLVVDNSKSVGDDKMMGMFQDAVKSIISSLTEHDRVGLIFFNENARVAGDYPTLMNATNSIKDELTNEVDNVETRGRTNCQAGFSAAFKLLKNSDVSSTGPKCNTAILLITDAPTNYPAGVGAKDIIDLVEDEMSDFTEANNTQIFTYSAEDNKEMREISCGIDGLWKGFTNTTKGGDMVADYHAFFAIGLGDAANMNFTAWVGPYRFSTGGITGITSSALVYDRSLTTPLFLGAVGADLTMDKVEQILGYGGTEAEETVKRVMLTFNETPTVVCPVTLSECGLEAARFWSSGYRGMCTINCTNISGVLPETCSGKDEFPDNLWENVKLTDDTYADRVCCEVGESKSSKQCPNIDLYGEPLLTNMEIFGIIFVAIAVIEILACVYWKYGFGFLKCKKKNPEY